MLIPLEVRRPAAGRLPAMPTEQAGPLTGLIDTF